MRIFASLFLGFLFSNSFSNGCCFCCGEGTSDDDSQEEYYIVGSRRDSFQKLPTSALLSGTADTFPTYGTVSAQHSVQEVSPLDKSIGGEQGFFVCAENAHRFESWGPHPDDVVAESLKDDSILDPHNAPRNEETSYQNQLPVVFRTEDSLNKKPWYTRLAHSLLNSG